MGKALGARVVYSDHLVELVAAAEAAATRLAGADPDRRAAVTAAARRESAYYSARLDGSPLTRDTAARVDRGEVDPAGLPRQDGGTDRGGSWARTLKLDAMPTQDVAAAEYANLLRCHDEEPALARRLLEEPVATLRALHEIVCAGLVAPEVAGATRRSEQAVHDGAQGKVIYNAVDPERLPALLDELDAWLGRGSAGLPTLVLAGVLHERLLEWQPFEAGNGRVARAAARLVLRARGLDPHGAAVPERVAAADPLGYYREVAATVHRRGDPGPWLERDGEAVVAALQAAAAEANPGPPLVPPAAAVQAVEGLGAGQTLTAAEYAARAGVSLDTARQHLRALTAAGIVRLDPGTRGLRFRRL